jgi:hypothetical protein
MKFGKASLIRKIVFKLYRAGIVSVFSCYYLMLLFLGQRNKLTVVAEVGELYGNSIYTLLLTYVIFDHAASLYMMCIFAFHICSELDFWVKLSW